MMKALMVVVAVAVDEMVIMAKMDDDDSDE
jgi:hypothetical protein